MNSATIIIIIILVAIAVFTIKEYRKRLTSGCCGSGDAPPKRIKVKDKNPRHYQYIIMMSLEGMTCRNCAIRIENALNSLDGVWATVDFANKVATIRTQKNIAPEEFRTLIIKTGYGADIL